MRFSAPPSTTICSLHVSKLFGGGAEVPFDGAIELRAADTIACLLARGWQLTCLAGVMHHRSSCRPSAGVDQAWAGLRFTQVQGNYA